MFDLGNIVGLIFQNAAKLIPGRMIFDPQRGIRFTRGHARREQLGPGWWWFLPLYQTIDAVSVKDQVKDIDTQSLTTKDDVAVSVSMCIEYEIFDAVLWYTEVHDFDESLHGLAKIYLARGIRSRDYAYLRRHQSRVERAIQKALSRHAEKWGVRILTVGLETYVRARQHRVMGDTPKHLFG